MTKTAFVGGSLSFKGEKKKSKKKSRKSKHRSEDEKKAKQRNKQEDEGASHVDDDMTEAEQRAMKRKLEREKKDLEKLASKSHRERIEEFNQKLGELTELNDIPRVSAAGNG